MFSYSLRDLAELAKTVADKVDKIRTRVVTRVQFVRLEQELNILQQYAPDFSAVKAARTVWFLHGLASFERVFVVPVEQHIGNWLELGADPIDANSELPSGLLMDVGQIEHSLCLRYLGPATSEVYRQVQELYDRLKRAYEGTDQGQLWAERAGGLLDHMVQAGVR